MRRHGDVSRIAWVAALAFCASVTTPAQAETDEARLRTTLGVAYARQGHVDQAAKQLSLVSDQLATHPVALNNLANVLFLQGKTARALELYERAMRAAPSQGEIRLNLAILMHTLGDSLASAEHLLKAAELLVQPTLFSQLFDVPADSTPARRIALATERVRSWTAITPSRLAWIEMN